MLRRLCHARGQVYALRVKLGYLGLDIDDPHVTETEMTKQMFSLARPDHHGNEVLTRRARVKEEFCIAESRTRQRHFRRADEPMVGFDVHDVMSVD